jgi:hypothetical protein
VLYSLQILYLGARSQAYHTYMSNRQYGAPVTMLAKALSDLVRFHLVEKSLVFDIEWQLFVFLRISGCQKFWRLIPDGVSDFIDWLKVPKIREHCFELKRCFSISCLEYLANCSIDKQQLF